MEPDLAVRRRRKRTLRWKRVRWAMIETTARVITAVGTAASSATVPAAVLLPRAIFPCSPPTKSRYRTGVHDLVLIQQGRKCIRGRVAITNSSTVGACTGCTSSAAVPAVGSGRWGSGGSRSGETLCAHDTAGMWRGEPRGAPETVGRGSGSRGVLRILFL